MEQEILEHRKRTLKDFPYLPLFYLIPDEIAQKRKLDSFPRDPYVAATTPEWIAAYHSKWFQVMVLDTWGWMMWQCLGIRGGVDNDSKNDPFVLMTFSLPMWAALLAEQGIHTNFLALHFCGTEIPFPSMEVAAHNCGEIAKRFWAHPELKMREAGYTQKEIAQALGYANHSGVTKRIEYMYREFQKYRKEDGSHL